MTDTAATTELVMRRYLDALTAGDVAMITDSFAEDATWWLHGDLPLAGTRRGREEILRFLLGAATLFVPDTQGFEFADLIVAGDHAVLEWRVTGTGVATERAYDNRYAGVFVVRDGRIAEVREYLDTRHAAEVLF